MPYSQQKSTQLKFDWHIHYYFRENSHISASVGSLRAATATLEFFLEKSLPYGLNYSLLFWNADFIFV